MYWRCPLLRLPSGATRLPPLLLPHCTSPTPMTIHKKAGFSGGHRISYSHPTFTNHGKSISVNRTSAEIKRARERAKDHMAALSFTQREQLLGHGDHDIEMPEATEDYSADWQPFNSDDEEAFQMLPPGQERYFHSHAGKEAAFHEVFDKCRPGRGDPRRRALRVQTAVDAWKQQIAYLVEAYFKLKCGGALNSNTAPGGWPVEYFQSTVPGILSPV
ncbi:hypothetical protein C8R45DRAFT_942640 [Mycena sanguinolenta]|nr:hypothetical protein C8R45DRAFT_942640 [Mycena sanguinolenta]